MNLTNLTLRQAVSFSCGQALFSWTSGVLFLLGWLINSSLGYPLSLLDTLGFFCLLCWLQRFSWRAFQFILIVCSVVAACHFPFGRTYGAPNFNSVDFSVSSTRQRRVKYCWFSRSGTIWYPWAFSEAW